MQIHVLSQRSPSRINVQVFACTNLEIGVLMVSEMNVCQAVQQLRTVSGLSQQAFANRFDMSVRAVANYEKNRVPNKQALFKFVEYAKGLNQPELTAIFTAAFVQESGLARTMLGMKLTRDVHHLETPNDDDERALIATILCLHRHRALAPGFKEIESMAIAELEALAAKGNVAESGYDYIQDVLELAKAMLRPSAQIKLERIAHERMRETKEPWGEAYGWARTNHPDLVREALSDTGWRDRDIPPRGSPIVAIEIDGEAVSLLPETKEPQRKAVRKLSARGGKK